MDALTIGKGCRVDPWLMAALGTGACLGLCGFMWGLPTVKHSWAVDALEPVTVLGIVRRSFSSWNSGWFYFKYPLAHPFLLFFAYVPYLGYLFLTQGWLHPTSVYPYGFSDPQRTLLVLAVLGRTLSLVCFIATIALVYGIGRRLFGRGTGRLGAWFTATCYPFVYYAHTTNVDAGYLCWLFLALWFALAASDSDRPPPWVGLGFAAAMAVSTKEQAFGFLLPLPFLVIGSRVSKRGTVRVVWGRPVVLMALTAVSVAILMNNALFNPLGVVARLAFLMGHPLGPVDAPLKPVSFALFKGSQELTYLVQLGDALASGLGTPLLLCAVGGALLLWRYPRLVLWVLSPAAGYYFLSLRGQELITMRYSLPLLVLSTLPAAWFLIRLSGRPSAQSLRALGSCAVATLAVFSLARGIELDLLLCRDPRYAAEEWMQRHLPASARGEVYQQPTYLPRFPSTLSVTEIPLRERSVTGLRTRRPDFIVLSSASRKSISHKWSADWRKSGAMLVGVPDAEVLLRELTEGRLNYMPVAEFRRQPRLLREGITGVSPEITIYRRMPEKTSTGVPVAIGNPIS